MVAKIAKTMATGATNANPSAALEERRGAGSAEQGREHAVNEGAAVAIVAREFAHARCRSTGQDDLENAQQV